VPKSRKQLKAERDEAWRVADVLREENHAMWKRIAAGGELARAQLRAAGHGVRCSCRLCRAARLTLNLSTVTELQQELLRGVG